MIRFLVGLLLGCAVSAATAQKALNGRDPAGTLYAPDQYFYIAGGMDDSNVGHRLYVNKDGKVRCE